MLFWSAKSPGTLAMDTAARSGTLTRAGGLVYAGHVLSIDLFSWALATAGRSSNVRIYRVHVICAAHLGLHACMPTQHVVHAAPTRSAMSSAGQGRPWRA